VLRCRSFITTYIFFSEIKDYIGFKQKKKAEFICMKGFYDE